MSLLKNITGNRWSLLLVMVLLLAVNILASRWHTRIDLTGEKRFTLSDSTEAILKRLKEPVTITVLLKGNYPSGFKKIASSTEDLLRTFKEIAGNKLQYRFVSADETIESTDVTYADTAYALGANPINLTSQLKDGQQQQYVYPVALVSSNGKMLSASLYKGKTPLVTNEAFAQAETMLEYQLINAIFHISESRKPLIGYAVGNGEPMDLSVSDLAENTIQRECNLQLINIASQPFINPLCDLLVIVKPTNPFTADQKLKIDQYIIHGGKVMFFVDRLNAEMDSLQLKNEVIAYDRELNLNDLLFRYGARINANLLMDLQCDFLPFDVSGSGQFDFLPWNYFPVLESAENHPINKGLGFVSGKFVNSIDTVEAEGICKTILLYSSPNSRTISTPALISGKENVAAPVDDQYNLNHLPAAVLLEGKFRSLFANRLTNAMKDSMDAVKMPFYPQAYQPSKVLVVADGDVVLNPVIKGNQPIGMGMNPFTFETEREFPFANRDFVLNAIEYMVYNNGLSAVKSKEVKVYLMDPKRVRSEKTFWVLLNVITPNLFIAFFAIFFQWMRKRKYHK
jgi:gliding-associated putative ABC transporter substrate-binding component GldG